MKSYCHMCGVKYIDGQETPKKCPGCGNVVYDNPVPTADIVLFNTNGQVVICERGEEPFKGWYDLPGGFLEINETLEDGIVREVAEELGITKEAYTDPVFVASIVGPSEYAKEVKELVMVVFTSKLKRDMPIQAHDDVANVKFVDLNELDDIRFTRKQYPAIIRKAHEILFG